MARLRRRLFVLRGLLLRIRASHRGTFCSSCINKYRWHTRYLTLCTRALKANHCGHPFEPKHAGNMPFRLHIPSRSMVGMVYRSDNKRTLGK